MDMVDWTCWRLIPLLDGQDPPGSDDHLQPSSQQEDPLLASQQATSSAEAPLAHHPAVGKSSVAAEAAPTSSAPSTAADRLPDGLPLSQAGSLIRLAGHGGTHHEPPAASLVQGAPGAHVEAAGGAVHSSPESRISDPAAPSAALSEPPASGVPGSQVKSLPAEDIKVELPPQPKSEFKYQAEHIEGPPKKRSRLSRSSAAYTDGIDQQHGPVLAAEVGLQDDGMAVEERPKGKRPVAAAVFCAFGAGLAQLPFIATQLGERRRGHARSLCNAVSTPLAIHVLFSFAVDSSATRVAAWRCNAIETHLASLPCCHPPDFDEAWQCLL